MFYAENGSLRQHLTDSFNSMKWEKKLDTLQRIARGLKNIHEKGLVHCDFHCGNILNNVENTTYITDLGLCRPANVKSSQDDDIYGFGIIAYEVCIGLPPYHDIPHDKILVISICNGLRPKSDYKIPQLILDIIKQCWDADSLKRPKAKELYDLLKNLFDKSHSYYGHEFNKQIEEADEINEKLISSSLLYTAGTTLSYNTNPQAVYTSRLLDFKNLPVPKNAIDNKADVGEYSESIEAIDFTNLSLGIHLH
ncbi:kinase-like domain-containing protein [Rhizophagus diaphanus]|nr:kinase-like domain-containing protein [Rhizophagus diaphanus] [Rhizophagus sp. MUCL 43196]